MFIALFLFVVVSDPQSAPEAKPEPRRYHEINRDINELLKHEARATSQAERALAVCRMSVLYRELVLDPRLATSDTLKEYKARLWYRLTKIKADVKRDLAKNGPPANGKSDSQSTSPGTELAAADSAAANSGAAGGANGGAAQADWGPQLVDLIEATINPMFWDTNGGPGTIVYYQPLRALVIRATGEQHREIGGLLRALGR